MSEVWRQTCPPGSRRVLRRDLEEKLKHMGPLSMQEGFHPVGVSVHCTLLTRNSRVLPERQFNRTIHPLEGRNQCFAVPHGQSVWVQVTELLCTASGEVCIPGENGGKRKLPAENTGGYQTGLSCKCISRD